MNTWSASFASSRVLDVRGSVEGGLTPTLFVEVGLTKFLIWRLFVISHIIAFYRIPLILKSLDAVHCLLVFASY